MAGGGLHMSVKLAGDEELAARFGFLKRELEGKRRSTMHRAVVTLRDEERSLIHSPEGIARRGIRSDETGAGAALQGLVRPRNKAAVFSQRSRGENTRMPPIRAIARWLKRIGALRGRSSAFLVARAIARRGTRGHPIAQASLDARRSEIVGLFREMVVRALRKG